MTKLDDVVITLNYTVKNINELINMMNKPFDVPVMAWANFIGDIQLQATPQLEKFNKENEEQNEQKD